MTSAQMLFSPVITADGQALKPEYQVAALRVSRGLRMVGSATLTIYDPEFRVSMSNDLAIGKKVVITAPGQTTPLFKGQIVRVQLDQRPMSQPELTVVAYDLGYRLGRGSTVKAYLDVSFSDLISMIASRNSLTADADASTITHPYLLQTGSDHALLEMMCDRSGYEWWVDDTKLCFKKPVAGITTELDLQTDLIEFSVTASGLHPKTATVRGWDRDKQTGFSGTSTVSTATVKATSNFVDSAIAATDLTGVDGVHYGNRAPITQNEANQIATAEVGRWAAGAVLVEGSCEVNSAIVPGSTIKLVNVGPAAGSYPVTAVQHLFTADEFKTVFIAGDRRPTTLVDTLSGNSGGDSFRQFGLQIATVTNVNDPNKTGRIKVKYPSAPEDVESTWARLVSAGAGKDRGFVFLPEVGDEVLVGFEGGDTRQPVVLGGLYGEKSSIPDWAVDQGTVNARRITSRLGHRMEFGDGTTDETQHIAFTLKGDTHSIRVGKDKLTINVPANVPLEIVAGQGSFKIDGSGAVEIKGTKVSINATESLSMVSAGSAELKGKTTTDVQGSAMTVKGSASATVEGAGKLTLKGGVVMIN
jgi:phage baseplate assembly protein gpV